MEARDWPLRSNPRGMGRATQESNRPRQESTFYLVGHLTAVHDRMLALLGLGERLHPELDEVYITKGDRLLADPVSASGLRKAWAEVNRRLTVAFERFTPKDWLQKHEQFRFRNVAAIVTCEKDRDLRDLIRCSVSA